MDVTDLLWVIIILNCMFVNIFQSSEKEAYILLYVSNY